MKKFYLNIVIQKIANIFFCRLTPYSFHLVNYQVFNEINSRDMENINVIRGMFDSWVFMAVLASTICFQVIIVEFLGTFAQTVPLSWDLWLLSVLIGALGLPIAAVLKCVPVPVARYVSEDHHHHDYQPLPTGPELA